MTYDYSAIDQRIIQSVDVGHSNSQEHCDYYSFEMRISLYSYSMLCGSNQHKLGK